MRASVIPLDDAFDVCRRKKVDASGEDRSVTRWCVRPEVTDVSRVSIEPGLAFKAPGVGARNGQRRGGPGNAEASVVKRTWEGRIAVQRSSGASFLNELCWQGSCSESSRCNLEI